ncbi:glycosyl hydrolase family 7 domain-containing protein [Sarocladium implicatum]|nr:glycosyl hydrolase family 7 domain-containing protein [Sarocladium implicatum]
MYKKIAAATALIASVKAQQVCTLTAESPPALSWQQCTASGCTDVSGAVTLDANWRWTHTVEGSDNCYTGNTWDSSLCPDGATCAENCCLDGAEYEATYGITTSGDALSLQFVNEGEYSTSIGSRVYLMDGDQYQSFELLGNEFTFDVDVSNIGCGLNGALYFVSMDLDGGVSRFPGNAAGAAYGTGYCDSQCPRDVKFIEGKANSDGWEGSDNDPNAGKGGLGTCCAEMDIWEANNIATAYTPHPCGNNAAHSCEGDECGGATAEDRYAGDCDPDGCDFNSYRQGNQTFYGPGSEFNIDTTKPLTVVTQFLAGDDGNLAEITRFYVQDGVVISNSESTIDGIPGNSITEEYCDNQKTTFGDEPSFQNQGGLAQMGDAVAKPMVLVMSLWSDHESNMLWLDSTFPVDGSGPGYERGSCSTDSGVPSELEESVPDATVVFSNIKFGPIGSTFSA